MANKNGILLTEPEIRREDFLEISWPLHDVVSEKLRLRYVSQQEINHKLEFRTIIQIKLQQTVTSKTQGC